MKKIMYITAVACSFVLLSLFLYKFTLDRTSPGCIQLADFYRLEENTVDVLFIGSSHVYYSINTCLLYDNYGVASYLLATPAQPAWISYYFLEEALKTQSPKLVVFDVCTLNRKEPDLGRASWPSLILMKPSLTKWDAIQAVNEEDPQLDAAGAFLSFPYFHTRYAQIGRQDYEDTRKLRYNGYKPAFGTISKKELDKWKHTSREKIAAVQPIPQRAETYFRKLASLCQKKHIPLLLVNAPHANLSSGKKMGYNYVAQVAQEYRVPFLDCNYCLEEMQMDFSKDLLEASHLNYYGSIKYTRYLASYLERSFQLPDRRGDSRYKTWEEASRYLMGRVGQMAK